MPYPPTNDVTTFPLLPGAQIDLGGGGHPVLHQILQGDMSQSRMQSLKLRLRCNLL